LIQPFRPELFSTESFRHQSSFQDSEKNTNDKKPWQVINPPGLNQKFSAALFSMGCAYPNSVNLAWQGAQPTGPAHLHQTRTCLILEWMDNPSAVGHLNQ
jgi:hypothetical protein